MEVVVAAAAEEGRVAAGFEAVLAVTALGAAKFRAPLAGNPIETTGSVQ